MKSKAQTSKEVFTIYLPVPLATKLRIEAAHSRETMTEIVTKAVRDYLEHIAEDRRVGRRIG